MAQSESAPRRNWASASQPVVNNTIIVNAPPQPPQPASRVYMHITQPVMPDAVAPIGSGWDPFNTEQYDHYDDNPFRLVADQPVSTFSIDVDTASYTNVRRMLQMGVCPPRDSVRIEEFINYFTYDYPVPDSDAPFSVNVDVASVPWQPKHRLVRIGLRGYEPPEDERPPCNLVFLIDVSGSMQTSNKLPLVKRSLQYLVKQLDERDRIALCVYAGAAGTVLPSTSCASKRVILDSIERLEAGGSTNGGQGIHLAYDIARANFRDGAVNRVIIATDGDINVGVTDRGELIRFIEERAKGGIFLTTLGFGFGNIKDGTLEQLADKGNGNYGYVDGFDEAKRIFGARMIANLVTIAKDVKIQVEFNPAEVESYRLIGYENRMLARADFNDDTKDAGEIGAGHTVTALYEVVPAGYHESEGTVDPLRYQTRPRASAAAQSGELLNLKLRYKTPSATRSQLLETPVVDSGIAFEHASADFRFATAVAAFAMVLRGNAPNDDIGYDTVYAWALGCVTHRHEQERQEFLDLILTASGLTG
ncbi:MAG: von Willebrand factor type A domain-containing protein [Candidatus Hydrogenedentes bacterium]|nr:von Willebrand factor type A domain-containing protein [Candidatus Hydrogenedentota bacterium]